jgi:hypothetical protein
LSSSGAGFDFRSASSSWQQGLVDRERFIEENYEERRDRA